MDIKEAIDSFGALAQETRLQVFKLLIEYGSSGIPAGKLGEKLDIPHNSLSFHLSHLSHAGLVSSRRDGRQIIYSANCERIEELIGFIKENCCVLEGAGASACAPVCETPSKRRQQKTQGGRK